MRLTFEPVRDQCKILSFGVLYRYSIQWSSHYRLICAEQEKDNLANGGDNAYGQVDKYENLLVTITIQNSGRIGSQVGTTLAGDSNTHVVSEMKRSSKMLSSSARKGNR